eukprot:CAMPEP_0113518006 /NCGR_PEP_ID=MMETSP0014_2-20120614/42601_1 /TAXON_ID=2857 /ORGANISM="Nitzschia sp." /LENGTH=87 /DNA_ID=CAMNT_0000415319 /DNA_START=74 /DNA_END=333 /DNA_ORIENTATION=- /assembly_acc=CAM_ASM_000159
MDLRQMVFDASLRAAAADRNSRDDVNIIRDTATSSSIISSSRKRRRSETTATDSPSILNDDFDPDVAVSEGEGGAADDDGDEYVDRG